MKTLIKKRKVLVTMVYLLIFFTGFAQPDLKTVTTIPLSPGEKVWAGIIVDGFNMPLKEGYKMDFYANNKGNQTQPLILTDKGQYVWSEEPYAFEVKSNALQISAVRGKILSGKAGNSLAEADETGENINGELHWMWAWQTDKLTYIHSNKSRGKLAIDSQFKNGLSKSILVTDRHRSYFNMNIADHQICLAHILGS